MHLPFKSCVLRTMEMAGSMTAHELARRLLLMPDVMVTVRGYEGGVNEVNMVYDADTLIIDFNDAWDYGKHEYEHDYYKGDKPELKRVQAIHISA